MECFKKAELGEYFYCYLWRFRLSYWIAKIDWSRGKRPGLKQEEKVNIIDKIEQEQMKDNVPDFKAGDKVKVHAKIREGEKERIQVFEGTVIRRKGGGLSANFTVRKMASGVGVERTFQLHSPNIDKIDVMTIGRVRRSRLYYLRDRTGKAARIKEKKTW